jgi:hypothetical protein
MAGALRALAERDLTLMAQAPGICFMVVQTGVASAIAGIIFLHNKAARCAELHSSLAICYLA